MEQVILVDENDVAIGTCEKMLAHEQALLHRAFSIFIFNENGEMLLQKRALSKYHSAGLWTNSCCSHPRPGEDTLKAANRRLQEEMGFFCTIEKAFEFVYQSAFENGLTENEFDHVYIGHYSGIVSCNPNEVMEYAYLAIDEIQNQLKNSPSLFTVWFQIAFPKVIQWREAQKIGIDKNATVSW